MAVTKPASGDNKHSSMPDLPTVGGVAAGAAAGSILGPLGAAVGALVGGVAGKNVAMRRAGGRKSPAKGSKQKEIKAPAAKRGKGKQSVQKAAAKSKNSKKATKKRQK